MTIFIDIEGPVFSQISFAHVVRSIAFALEDLGCCVSINATDPHSFGYKNVAIERNFDRLTTMTKRTPHGTIKILYNFPVSMGNKCKGYNFTIVSWETTSAPAEWIKELNLHADQVWSISSFVNEAFLSGGLQKQKAKILPMGVDQSIFHPNAKPNDLRTNKKFKFLHLGVAQHRKGTPLLLRAFTQAFTKKDDVALVIKSNGFGVIDRWIKNHQTDNGPEIAYIYEEAPENAMAGYYTASDCFVYPVHAEGAGLPVLESLACGRPAIVPLWSGLTDFCNVNNSFPIRHRIIPLEKPYSNYSGTGVETWAEISEKDLVTQLRYAASYPDLVKKKGDYAGAYTGQVFTWQKTAVTILKYINEIVKNPEIEELIQKNRTPTIEPIQLENKQISIEVKRKIGILACLDNFTEAYFYAKTALNKTLTPTIGFASRTATDSRYIRCIEPEMASPNSIITACKQQQINTLQIHWDRLFLPKDAVPGFLKVLHKNNLRVIFFVHDELPDNLPPDFFYLADFFVTTSIKTRNQLLYKNCPLARLKCLQPTRFFKDKPNNIEKIKTKMGIGTNNFTFMSPMILDKTYTFEFIDNFATKIINMPHVKYILLNLSSKINGHLTTNQSITFIPKPVNESSYMETLSIADAFILPYKSISNSPKNPAFLPLLSFDVPIITSADCLIEELDDVVNIEIAQYEKIANKKRETKNKLADIQEYIKLIESLYYRINAGPLPSFVPDVEVSTENLFDIDKSISLSEL